MSSNKISPSTSEDLLHDPPGYIKPNMQDFQLTDVGMVELKNDISQALEVQYLSPAVFPSTFPVKGHIFGKNHRLMINLACSRQTEKEAPAVNIIFVVDTGSPDTFLSKDAVEALIGKKVENFPSSLYVLIQDEERAIQCHLSPEHSHFADVNVLGMDSITDMGLMLAVNGKTKEFALNK
ncbi:hypothetical protein O9G_002796 [Rozella allomycis CSF55]|uniref:Peptidase A2 domain-containing protein n=1 Tax=Rozella allomycis (strain CSF55) TaxID=988480 RepID=A0A075AMM6_ROZAC|nr:hypothetical protein O9G_002796 [Rozella allomycis CSF55]|eukprot:EPZ30919.1 hypothetical protein O9G_002796 [Rozella allomycis CSF55]